MDHVLTFTRIFPDYHIRKGESTYFVEQILNNLINQNINCDVEDIEAKLGLSLISGFRTKCGSKGHTIRSGNDWKVGDKFTPGIWLAKPHLSKMVTISPDIEIKKVWTFECDENGKTKVADLYVDNTQEEEIAKNDGLLWNDYQEWIVMPCSRNEKPFKGQIICWDESISY